MSQASIVLGQGVVPQEQKAGEECCGEHSPRHQQFGQTLRHHTAQLSTLQQTSTDTLYWAPTLVSHHSKPSLTLVSHYSKPSLTLVSHYSKPSPTLVSHYSKSSPTLVSHYSKSSLTLVSHYSKSSPTLVSHYSKPSPTLVFCCSSPQKANSECNATDNSFLMATQPVQQTVRKYKYRALWASEHELNISPDNTSTGHFRHVNMN